MSQPVATLAYPAVNRVPEPTARQLRPRTMNKRPTSTATPLCSVEPTKQLASRNTNELQAIPSPYSQKRTVANPTGNPSTTPSSDPNRYPKSATKTRTQPVPDPRQHRADDYRRFLEQHVPQQPKQQEPAKSSRQDDLPEPPSVIETSAGTWELREILGKGGFGRVFKAYNRNTGKECAVKVMAKCAIRRQEVLERLKYEMLITRKSSHPNIVEFIHQHEDTEFLYLFIGLCPRGSLKDWTDRLGSISERKIRKVMSEVASGLNYLHEKMKTGHPESPTFGLCAQLREDNERRLTKCGTPNYVAPEIVTRIGHGTKADVWSFGVMVYIMAFSRAPWKGSSLKEVERNITSAPLQIPATCSPELEEVIRACLNRNPESRLTFRELLQLPFFLETSATQNLPPTREEERKKMRSKIQEELQEEYQSEDLNRRTKVNPLVAQMKALGMDDSNSSDDAEPGHATAQAKRAEPSKPAAPKPEAVNKAREPFQLRPKSTRDIFNNERVRRSRTAKPSDPSEKQAPQLAAPVAPVVSESPSAYVTYATNRPAFVEPIIMNLRNTLIDYELRRIDNIANEAPVQNPITSDAVFVRKFIRFPEVGLAYQFGDKAIGLNFLDNTSITLSSDRRSCQYRDHNSGEVTEFSPEKIPTTELKIKFKRIVESYRFMKTHLRSNSETVEQIRFDTRKLHVIGDLINSQHARMLLLSNHTVQFNFYDHQKILVREYGRTLVSIDPEGKTSEYFIEDIVTKRYRHMIPKIMHIMELLQSINLSNA
ncbi:kinase-like protein [Basidiobolus meristosporus CBS 931.73]|uniref:Kinase-like protein n=1 Tax=Basidiobolus meristosporus CBS 931.73 TaxID=1314790 RepID=A0A1Y1Y5B0_9FUNG|nr:kinase-like protein [Basidiobolus meristosporus CBS 931.73]|eukprot:ORX92906.1 kinase-like protein [Basidiobolus meristosporus CBS 931.73]